MTDRQLDKNLIIHVSLKSPLAYKYYNKIAKCHFERTRTYLFDSALVSLWYK